MRHFCCEYRSIIMTRLPDVCLFFTVRRGRQMATTVRDRAARLLTSNRNHVRYLGILAFMALVVGLGVTAMLKQNGVAMTHTEVVLDCHVAGEVAHTHNADCYDDEGRLVCTLPERELHTHTDECYEETRTLTCGLEESEGHQHTDACYDADGNLVCGLDESFVHSVIRKFPDK